MRPLEAWKARETGHLATLAALPSAPLASVTRQLRSERPGMWKARYLRSDRSGAVRAAARAARKEGAPRVVAPFVVHGATTWIVEAPGSPTFRRMLELARLYAEPSYVVQPDGAVSTILWDAAPST